MQYANDIEKQKRVRNRYRAKIPMSLVSRSKKGQSLSHKEMLNQIKNEKSEEIIKAFKALLTKA